MKASICPRCGSLSGEGLCDSCLLSTFTLMTYPDLVEVTLCPVCGARFFQGRWQFTDSRTEKLVTEAVLDLVKVHPALEDAHVALDLSPKGVTTYVCEIALEASFRGIPVEKRAQISVRLKYNTCDRCSRIAGRYFEGEVQVRARDRTPSKEELQHAAEVALTLADASFRRGERMAFIQEIRETKGGIDIVFGSTELGRKIAYGIQERLGGRIQESSKLVGRKEGRDLYRTTFLVRLPRFSQGDIILYRGEILEVMGHDGRRVSMTSLEDGRRKVFLEEKIEEARLLGSRREVERVMVVAVDEGAVEILDPKSYGTALVPRPRQLSFAPGDEVEILRAKDRIFLLKNIL